MIAEHLLTFLCGMAVGILLSVLARWIGKRLRKDKKGEGPEFRG